MTDETAIGIINSYDQAQALEKNNAIVQSCYAPIHNIIGR